MTMTHRLHHSVCDLYASNQISCTQSIIAYGYHLVGLHAYLQWVGHKQVDAPDQVLSMTEIMVPEHARR